jgi:tripartite-type tricarboxylate transporter receptor subunit TctC
MFRRGLMVAGALALVLTAAAQAVAQRDFPTKPVRLVIPYPPGGSHDAHARAFASVMEPYLGQPMLPVIRSGGGGSVGASFVARSPADGYTLILGDQQSILVKPMLESLPYSPDSFIPVCRMNYSPLFIAIKADKPWQSLKDLVAAAKKDPGKVSYGAVPGLGVDQIPMELLSLESGAEFKFVPFQGGGPVWQAFLGGDIDVAPAFPSTVSPHIDNKSVRVLAVTAPERLEQFKNIPTVKEQGFDVQFAMFRTIFAPKGTPPAVVTKLRESCKQGVEDQSFSSMVQRMGERVIYMSGADFEKFMVKEGASLKTLVEKVKKK